MLAGLFDHWKAKRRILQPSYRPRLETLEERMLLATDTWTGASGTINWSNPANWDTGHAPQNGDDLNINTSQVLTNDLTPGTIFNNITLIGCGIQGNAIVLTGSMSGPSNGAPATMNLNAITLGASVQFVGSLNVYSSVTCNGFDLSLVAQYYSTPPPSPYPNPPPVDGPPIFPPPTPTPAFGGIMFGPIQLSGSLSFDHWQVTGPITLTNSAAITLSNIPPSSISGGISVNGFNLTLFGAGYLDSCPINGPGTTTIAGSVFSFSVISTPVNVVDGGILVGGGMTGSLTFSSGSTYIPVISNATSYSQVQVNGPIDLGGATLSVSPPDSSHPVFFPPHTALVFLQSSGAITGTFGSLPDGAFVLFMNSEPFGIHYLPGQVVLTNDREWRDVVTGDFNGDGKQDIAGRDLSGIWWVSLSTGSGFGAPGSWTWWSRTTWLDVQTGDFNGDGKTDIVGRAAVNGQWWVSLSTGSSFNDQLWDTWSSGVTWADVKVGDFNGDGKADIAGRYLQGGTWWIGLSTGSGFSTTQWAAWSTGGTWVDVNVADFNGDHKADIVGRCLENGQWYVGLSNGSTGFNTTLWDTWSTAATWVDVRVGDFNGDGKADLTGRYLEGGSLWTAISNGSKFTTTLWDTWSTGATWVDVRVGDFNGDGKADLTGRYFQGGSWWTAISNGTSFTTTKWDTWSASANWVDVLAADFTGTGTASITGRYLDGGSWWTGVSSGTGFNTTLWTTWPA